MTETLANRRIFRSKLDTIRTDLRLRGRLPGARHRHGRPRRRRPRPVVLRHRPRHPGPRRGDGRGRRRAAVRRAGPPGRPRRSSTSRASRPATTTRRRSSSGSPPRPTTPWSRTCSPRPTPPPIREELIARRIDELHAAGSKAAVSATPGVARTVRAVLRRARRGPVPRPVAGLVGAPPRDGLRAAGARGLHAVHADPGRGRQHDQRAGRLPADGAGRRGDLRRRRARGRVHDARGAGHRDPAGHRDRRRGRGARPVPRRDRPLRARSSPTAA